MGIGKDISEELANRATIERQSLELVRASKLASLGELSAGVAHEINNPLAIIAASTGLLSKFRADPEKHDSKVQAIQKSVERISKIVMGLRKFARTGPKTKHATHLLSDILNEIIVLVDAKAKRHNTPVIVECQTNALINCDEVEIEQVLINLVSNAIDAVKTAPDKWVKIFLQEEQETVILRIMDSGPGIAESVKSKMFEPFFTTKEVGKGTGLGLSITKGILDEHQATITVLADSSHTCFEIRFPKAQQMKNTG